MQWQVIENEGIWMNGKRKLCPPTSTREKTPIYVHRSVMATGADHLRIYGRSTYQKPQPCCTPPVGPARCVIPWLRRQYEERMARQSLSLSLSWPRCCLSSAIRVQQVLAHLLLHNPEKRTEGHQCNDRSRGGFKMVHMVPRSAVDINDFSYQSPEITLWSLDRRLHYPHLRIETEGGSFNIAHTILSSEESNYKRGIMSLTAVCETSAVYENHQSKTSTAHGMGCFHLQLSLSFFAGIKYLRYLTHRTPATTFHDKQLVNEKRE